MGLTFRQAKIYLLLTRTGKQKATAISKTANADRSNVYQTLAQLQKKGLVAKILGKPTLYEAIPVQEAITNILEHKKKQYYKICEEAKEILRIIPANKMSSQKETEFRVTSYGKEAELKKVTHTCDTAEESIDLLLNKITFHTGVINYAEPHIKAMKRGVKYRIITEYTNPKPILKTLQTLMAEPNFQIKHIHYTPKVEICITDKRNAAISLIPNRGIGERPTLGTTNLGCLEIFQIFFDSIWNQAHEYKLKKISNRISRQKQVMS